LALAIDIDPALVDVNVSPTKSEVKFQREGQAFEALRLAIKSALMEHGMMPSALSQGVAAANEALATTESGQRRTEWASGNPSLYQAAQWAQSPIQDYRSHPDPTPPTTEFHPDSAIRSPISAIGTSPFGPPPQTRYPFGDLMEGLRVIGQSMNTFIIAETNRGIVIIDQHVAHERILYEYLCGLKGPTAIEQQALLVPQTLHLDKRAAMLLRERIGEVEAVGFSLEPFGGESYVVRAVPAAVRNKDPLKILRDMIDELVESSVTRRLVPTREQIWITSSCKMAVKAGDPLSHAEMEKLILDLAETENPYMCPHGRPITLTLTTDELLRKFKRT
jgi:DNA mismatch repair protein MutL